MRTLYTRVDEHGHSMKLQSLAAGLRVSVDSPGMPATSVYVSVEDLAYMLDAAKHEAAAPEAPPATPPGANLPE